MQSSTDESGCPKCGHQDAVTDQISTTGGGLSKMFDIQSKSFQVVSCTNCGYSELYRSDRQRGSDLVDVFLGQMPGVGVGFLFLVFALGLPFLLYRLLDAEDPDQSRATSWDDARSRARNDGSRRGQRDRKEDDDDRGVEGNHWN